MPLRSLIVKKETLHEDNYDQKFATTGYVVKEEIILKAPVNGRISAIAPEGKKIKKGAEAFKIKANSDEKEYSVTAEKSGIFFQSVDGYESFLRYGEAETIGFFFSLPNTIEDQLNKSDYYQAGDNVGKIVNNLKAMQLLVKVPSSYLETSELKIGSNLIFIIKELTREISFKLIDYLDKQEEIVLLLQTEDVREFLTGRREVEVEFISARRKGMLVSQKSLVVKEEKTGLYILNKGIVVWREVEIIEELDEDFVLIEPLPVFTEIISNPKFTKEGRFVY